MSCVLSRIFWISCISCPGCVWIIYHTWCTSSDILFIFSYLGFVLATAPPAPPPTKLMPFIISGMAIHHTTATIFIGITRFYLIGMSEFVSFTGTDIDMQHQQKYMHRSIHSVVVTLPLTKIYFAIT